MPLWDVQCRTCGTVRPDVYFHTNDKPNPACDACGGETGRMINNFRSPLMGAITRRYNDSRLESSHMEGHVAYRKDGTPVRIETFEQQRKFCKQEGLVAPEDIGPQMAGSDGAPLSSRGLPGCW